MNEVVARIRQAGILAVLPGDLSLQSILQVGDALLAAPVLGVEIAWGADADARLISDLVRRGGANLLVGVGNVETAVVAQTAIDAGAQYIASPHPDLELMAFCRGRDVLYLPGVITIQTAFLMQQAGGAGVLLRTGGPAGPAFVASMRQALPDLHILVAGDVSVVNVGQYAYAGADAVLIGDALFAGPHQTMADIIRRARALQRAWDEGGHVHPRQNGLLR